MTYIENDTKHADNDTIDGEIYQFAAFYDIYHELAGETAGYESTKSTGYDRQHPQPLSQHGRIFQKIKQRKKRLTEYGNENHKKRELCHLFFLLPSNKPVAMVVPERDSPGSTATA